MRTSFVGVAIITAALLALVACSNGGTTTGPATTTGEATTVGAATRVEVTENEYTISLPRTNFSPGAYTFVVDNQGGEPHDLWIKGPGVDDAKTETLSGGSQGEVTVTLQPGIYELWCSISDHRERGMELTVTVAG